MASDNRSERAILKHLVNGVWAGVGAKRSQQGLVTHTIIFDGDRWGGPITSQIAVAIITEETIACTATRLIGSSKVSLARTSILLGTGRRPPRG
jgi:hypothetical protein